MWLLPLAACGGDGPLSSGVVQDQGPRCSVDESLFVSGGVAKDGIPALTDPVLVAADDAEAGYLRPDDRVIGLRVDTLVLAVPHNILWWHEIVNLNLPGRRLVVTYCPLTGSALAFDRSAVGGAEFGVSGILFRNNLVMYDRRDVESLWPQMLAAAACGPKKGATLEPVAVREMSWEGWRRLYPDTRVLSSETGFDRNYRQYPYGGYEDLYEKPFVPVGGDPDPRRPPKERVLGIPDGKGGGAGFPFLALDARGALWVENVEVAGVRYVVIWDREVASAVAYRARPLSAVDTPVGPSGPLIFEVRDGRIVDRETESVWTVAGRSTEGALAGSRLEEAERAYVAFWFAWSAFNPDAVLWEE